MSSMLSCSTYQSNTSPPNCKTSANFLQKNTEYLRSFRDIRNIRELRDIRNIRELRDIVGRMKFDYGQGNKIRVIFRSRKQCYIHINTHKHDASSSTQIWPVHLSPQQLKMDCLSMSFLHNSK